MEEFDVAKLVDDVAATIQIFGPGEKVHDGDDVLVLQPNIDVYKAPGASDPKAMAEQLLWVAAHRDEARAQALRGREYVVREWNRD